MLILLFTFVIEPLKILMNSGLEGKSFQAIPYIVKPISFSNNIRSPKRGKKVSILLGYYLILDLCITDKKK